MRGGMNTAIRRSGTMVHEQAKKRAYALISFHKHFTSYLNKSRYAFMGGGETRKFRNKV